jgi:hypothetical protein
VGIVIALAHIASSTVPSLGEPDPCSLVKLMVSGWTSDDVHTYNACTGDYLSSLYRPGDFRQGSRSMSGSTQERSKKGWLGRNKRK